MLGRSDHRPIGAPKGSWYGGPHPYRLQREDEMVTNKLYVGNLSFNTTAEAVRDTIRGDR